MGLSVDFSSTLKRIEKIHVKLRQTKPLRLKTSITTNTASHFSCFNRTWVLEIILARLTWTLQEITCLGLHRGNEFKDYLKRQNLANKMC